jgi:leucyl aminopeptidase (aminopeptidase T)
MNTIEYGAKQAVVNCVKVQPGEKVVLITDRHTERLADAIAAEAEKVEATVEKFIMEDFGERPDDGSKPLGFPDRIGQALAGAKVSFYIAQGKAGELHSFRMPMVEYVAKHDLRHAHMPNFEEKMMGTGMAADYAEIQRICRAVYDIVKDAKEIHVTTAAGTDMTARFDPNLKWIISDGDIRPGEWSNLPDGEVFTAPIDANGTVVIDGTLGDFFNAKYGDLSGTPLRYRLENGAAVRDSVECNNDGLKREFIEYTFETDENSHRLGEFAIGTNVGLKELIGNLLQDEKFPGVHLALGNPYPDKTGADWASKAHNDGIMRNPTIVVDGRTIMKDGQFDL